MKGGLTAQVLAPAYPSPIGLAYAQLEFLLEVILETANSRSLNRNKLILVGSFHIKSVTLPVSDSKIHTCIQRATTINMREIPHLRILTFFLYDSDFFV